MAHINTCFKIPCAFLTLLYLSGCSTFSKDGGFCEVSSLVQERVIQQPVWLRTDEQRAAQQEIVNAMLEEILVADKVVSIALMNNPALQKALMDLGIAEADLVQSGRIRNPSLSYAKLNPVSDEYDIERAAVFDVMSFLTMPMRSAIEKQHFQQAKLQAAIDILEIATQTTKAYYSAIAAQQIVGYLEKVKEASQASAQLAQRMVEVGNWNRLQQAREQAFYAQIMAQLADAKLQAIKERERLTRLLGLWGEQIAFKLPARLPELPSSVQEPDELEKQALCLRLDIQAIKHEIDKKCKALKLTKATRFIDVFDLGYIRNSSDDRPHQTGYAIALEIPLFDWGDAKVSKAQDIYMQSVWHLREVAINARSEVREAYQIYRIHYDKAKFYRDEIVSLRKNILDESLLRYNGMLIGTFELLEDEREQIMSVNAYIEALRDFWLAQADLQTTLMVTSPSHAVN
ncbi:TolC family protein [Candidatus Berkiella aquae]|uniref:Putative outer membrane efflux protein MdtP n=1 Tax=Candidatus Berkiella aquae TaxID=295108 RepID=A0A0Q9YMK2_9GAMM|nr:TolC family protein [Candidatus Berkiella aquae]MCS5710306.1 TolC family protein [Candidatus Berkiella aquae]